MACAAARNALATSRARQGHAKGALHAYEGSGLYRQALRPHSGQEPFAILLHAQLRAEAAEKVLA